MMRTITNAAHSNQQSAKKTTPTIQIGRHLPRSAMILAGLLALLASTVFCGGDPPAPQPWFTEHLAINQGTFPSGVSIGVVPNTTSRLPAEYLVITNTSPTLLYLTAIESPNHASTGPVFATPAVQLPSPGIPVFRAASGQAFVWDVTSDSPPWTLRWKPVQQYLPSDALWLSIFGQYLEVRASAYFQYYVLKIEARNKFDYGGQRPANVQIPPPQTAVLPIVYGANQINLPLTISYTLNQTYETSQPAGSLFPDAGVLMPIVLTALIALLGLVFTWFMRESRKSSTGSK